MDNLLSSVQKWLSSLGCSATTVTEVLQTGPHPNLLAALQEGIDRVNQLATSNAQKIQKFSLLPMDFSIPSGELGKTMLKILKYSIRLSLFLLLLLCTININLHRCQM